ncbi:MAG: phosphate signaling complex protein PhoU [Candidatus Hydrogenedentes bacterium]|nr:phosphate signaling complex protein PhoU [Candidatus Hydrogenedentota bacterium]
MTLHFQREIERLKTDLLSLSALVEDTLHRAITSLRERDGALARIIIDTDPDIDQREVDIEEECQKILALHQPVAHDLRFLIACLKINAELERIGDAAVNIAERVVFLVTQEPIEVPFDYMGMAKKAETMLRNSLDALVNLNVNLAYEVIDADDEVDAFNREAYVQIENCIQKNPTLASSYTHLLGISRHIERIGDHATNIAEDVVYLIEGAIIRHRTEEYRPANHQ